MNNNQNVNPNLNNNVGNTPVNPMVPPVNPQPQLNQTMPNQVNVSNNTGFFNQGVPTQVNTPSINETTINDLKVDGTYNNINVAPDYVNDQAIKEKMEEPKKNTVPVSKELKTVIIIAVVLLIFIIVMPFLFDVISNIRFN